METKEKKVLEFQPESTEGAIHVLDKLNEELKKKEGLEEWLCSGATTDKREPWMQQAHWLEIQLLKTNIESIKNQIITQKFDL